MCGGTPAFWRRTAMRIGLSPRVRGNPAAVAQCRLRNRSIPACAGEPVYRLRNRRLSPVYPRVCGGTLSPSEPPRGPVGLSPRVRGNPSEPPPGPVLRRSIPACAGEPLICHLPNRHHRVYPRVCGGTRQQRATRMRPWGLSPRVRGNRRTANTPRCRNRSIPACAGEPDTLIYQTPGGEVYPRVCGGTLYHKESGYKYRGLSPRVRGNPLDLDLAPNTVGSIPACAGEPPGRRLSPSPSPVYPRVCGGTVPGGAILNPGQGLSPRVRGNRRLAGGGAVRPGSIPACAGEPRRQGIRIAALEVYPRVCGGTGGRRSAADRTLGLSPRVRGNREIRSPIQ